MMPPLYRRLLAIRFDELPPAVRALHDVSSESVWRGRADVERGGGRAARLLAGLLGLPPEGRDQALTVTFTPRRDAEVWTREFGRRRFVSVQSADSDILREQIGPVSLRMRLDQDDDGLALAMIAATAFGLPVPRMLLPQIRTRESDVDGRYHFDVQASMPGVGPVVHYHGWLEREAR